MAKTTDQLLQQAIQIRDEQANKKNTALRVGTLFSDLINKQDELEQTHNTDITKINEEVTDNRNKLTELDSNIGGMVNETVNNPEYIRAYVDSEGKFLWGIKLDGSVEWAKGIPTPVKSSLNELENKIKEITTNVDTNIDEIENKVTSLQENDEQIEKSITNLSSAIDVINAALTPLTETFSIISNEEYLHAIVDSEGRILFAIKNDGTTFLPKQETYQITSNEEWLAAWLDSENKILFGVKSDGTFYAAKHNFSAGGNYDEQIHNINDTLSTVQSSITSLQNSIKSNSDDITQLKQDVSTLQGGNEAMQMLSVFDDVEGRTEITTDSEGRILSYRDEDGVKHEEKLDVNKLTQNGTEININNLATKEDASFSNINLSELNGVEDHSLVNLFNKDAIRTYDSDFADKVYAKIGNKTGETGCYSNNIPCKAGDWFTRSDFGTGIVVVLDENENVLGNVANAAYSPTVQIVPAKEEYDFSTAKYAVFVVMLENLDSERIVKAKYMPTGEGDYLTIPKLKVMSDNMDKDVTTYIKGTSGRYYQLQINDSGESPVLTPVALEGIPASELPSYFPTFSVSGDFSEYYDGIVLSPVEGGVTNYLYELASNGLVKRYFKQRVNCPRVLKEGDTWYYYGVNGSLNSSSGKLNIYKANGETFELVKGNLGNSKGENIEPHDCLVISVNPLHYICQRYVSNQTTTVDGQPKIVTSLHVEEVYEGTSVWEWHSEDYPELWVDSHIQGDNADYLHNNTISIASDGNLYLNNKHANQILIIQRTWDDETHTGTIGGILWKVGGNRTHSGWDVDTRIKTTTEQQWYESHDAVISSNGLITMYDNKTSGASRILEFNIDTKNKVLTNFIAHTWNEYRGRYMGSVDKCAEGVYLVSWGSQRNGNAANAGIYDFNNNKIIFEIRFDDTGSSAYRVYGIPKGE